MAGLRRAATFLMFQIGRAAERVARTTGYLVAGTRQLTEMQRDQEQVWQAFYETHPSHDPRLMGWEDEWVDRFVQPGAAVLLVGCGSGRDLVPLAERGCRVTGIDLSETALGITSRLLGTRGLSATLLGGLFEDTAIRQTFDAVVFSYYCYSSIPMARRRIAALEKAAALLNADGHVIVSHAAGLPRPRAALVSLARLAGTIARSDWRVEPGDLVWDNRAGRPSLSYTHAFENGEIEREAAAANLEVVCRRVVDDAVVLVMAHP